MQAESKSFNVMIFVNTLNLWNISTSAGLQILVNLVGLYRPILKKKFDKKLG